MNSTSWVKKMLTLTIGQKVLHSTVFSAGRGRGNYDTLTQHGRHDFVKIKILTLTIGQMMLHSTVQCGVMY